MDHLSFLFSLLLIVSVTTSTFGSVIKAKNPNGESLEEPRSDPDLFPNMARKELGAFLERSHHQSNPNMKTGLQAKLQGQNGLKYQENEMSKRVDPETLIPGTIALESSTANTREVTIEVSNFGGYEWTGGSIYIFSPADEGYPEPLSQVISGTTFDYVAANPNGAVAGVLVYHIGIKGEKFSLAMWFSFFHNVNLWNVKMYDNYVNPGLAMYTEMLFSSEAANNQLNDGDLAGNLKYRVSMSTSPDADLRIIIFKPSLARKTSIQE